MWFPNWLKDANRKSRVSRRHSRRAERSARARFVPRLEALEDRTVLSTLTVTSALDDGSRWTLRAVIDSASPGVTINFAKKLACDTITLTHGQLAITNNLAIDGQG